MMPVVSIKKHPREMSECLHIETPDSASEGLPMIPDWILAHTRSSPVVPALAGAKPRVSLSPGQQLETTDGTVFAVTAWTWPRVCGLDNHGETVFATYTATGEWARIEWQSNREWIEAPDRAQEAA